MKYTPRFQSITIALVLTWLALFVFIPNLLIFITSLLTRHEKQLITATFTLMNYQRLLDPLYLAVLAHSLFMAITATVCCLCIGYPFAFIVASASKRWQRCLLMMLIVPFWTNSLVRIYGLKLLIGAKGVLNSLLLTLGFIQQPFQIMYSESAVVMGLVYILLPFMILPLYSSLEKLDRRYLEAAKDLGASRWQRFWGIIVPLTLPGIIGGVVLVFLPAMGMFYVSDLLGGAKNLLIGNVIKTQFLNARDWPFGAATSISLTLCMSLLLLLYYRMAQRHYSKESFS